MTTMGQGLALRSAVQPGKSSAVDGPAGWQAPGRATLVGGKQPAGDREPHTNGHAPPEGGEHADLHQRATSDVIGAMAAVDRGERSGQLPRAGEGAESFGSTMWRVTEQRAATLYRRAQEDGDVRVHDPAVEASLRAIGGGSPLPDEARQQLEAEFGVSFARVRIHTDGVAAAAASAVRARAFTVGEDIFFAQGAYAPESAAGRRLLAHELTHVVQAMEGRTNNRGGERSVSDPHDSLEHEADARAERIGMGGAPQGNAVPHAPNAISAASASTRTAAPSASPQLMRKVDPALAANAPAETHAARPLGANDVGGHEPAPGAATSAPQGLASAHETIPGIEELTRRSPQQRAAHVQRFDAAIAGMKQAGETKLHAAAAGESEVTHARVHGEAETARAGHEQHAHAAIHHVQTEPHSSGAAPAAAGQAHGPIELKKISDWNKYLPPQAKGADPRERQQMLHMVQQKVAQDRAAATHVFEHLRGAELQAAAKVHALEPKLKAEMERSRQRALGEVSSSEAAQTATIHAHAAGVAAQVQGSAATAKSQVTSAHARTVSEINRSLQQSTQQLAREHQQALKGSQTAETAQIAAIAAKFAAASAQIVALGNQTASEASGLGESTPLPYTGAKLTAARKAANQVAQQYAQAMPQQAEKANTGLAKHQPAMDDAVHKIASENRQHIDTTFHNATRMLQAAHKQMLAAADQAKVGALRQIDQSASSSAAQIRSAAAAQVAGVHAQAAGARTQIANNASSGVSTISSACSKAVKELGDGASQIAQSAHDIEAPNAQELQHKSVAALAKFSSTESALLENLQKEASQSASAISSLGTGTARSLMLLAGQARATTSQLGTGAEQAMTQGAHGAEQSLQQIAQGFEKNAQQLTNAASKSFQDLNEAEQREYKNELSKLESGLQQNYAGLQKSFEQAVPGKEVEDIKKNAAKAAAAVHSGGGLFGSIMHWVAFVAIIVIVVVVVIALSILTDGIADVFLADAAPWVSVLFDTGAEAFAGAVSNGVQQALTNVWVDHQGWSEGVFGWRGALVQGAVAGGVAGGLAKGSELAVEELAGKEAISVFGKDIGIKGIGEAFEGLKTGLEKDGFSWARASADLVFGTLGTALQSAIGGFTWRGFIENWAGNIAIAGVSGHGALERWREGVAYHARGELGKDTHAAGHAGDSGGGDPAYTPKHAKPEGDPAYTPKHAKPEASRGDG